MPVFSLAEHYWSYLLSIAPSWATLLGIHDHDAEFVLSLHLHDGNDERSARQWWGEHLHLNDPDFTKTFIKPPGTGHRKNHLPHGVCRVRMRRSADALYRTLAWIDVIADALGTDERSPEC